MCVYPTRINQFLSGAVCDACTCSSQFHLLGYSSILNHGDYIPKRERHAHIHGLKGLPRGGDRGGGLLGGQPPPEPRSSL